MAVDETDGAVARVSNTHFFLRPYEKSAWWSCNLHVDKHESFIQIDTAGDYLILMGMVEHSQSS